MRRSGRLFIVLGVALALIAGLLAVIALTGDDSDDTTSGDNDRTEPQEITIVTAARDVPAHERITEDDIQEEVVDADTVSGDAVTSRLEVIGLAYADDLTTGQALMRTRLETPGLANRIEPGRRAFALPVDAAGLVGGLVRDDDHLDLIFDTRVDLYRVTPTLPLEAFDRLEIEGVEDPETGQNALLIPPPGEDFGPTYPYPGEDGSRFWISDVDLGDPLTKVMLQNVRVLRTIAPVIADSGNVTTGAFLILDVSPEEAEILRFMMANGTYQIVLRGLEDDGIANTDGLTYNAMVDELGLPVPKTVRLPGAGAQ
jgi:pilus assembly protein CpaB